MTLFFIDEEHEQNFKKTMMRWGHSRASAEYTAACYILAVPMLFVKVGHMLHSFESPVEWIWRWEEKYTLASESEALYEYNIGYDLTSSMVQLGKLSLNLWNGYEHFNLVQCIDAMDKKHYPAMMEAIAIRSGETK